MGLQIETRPIINIDDNNLSKWNAAFSPILFTGTRKDVTATSVLSGNSTSINVNWLGLGNQTPIEGEFIYLSIGSYQGTFKVLFAPSLTLIRLETPFISTANNGYINLNSTRPNYHVKLEIYKIVNSSYVLLTAMIFRTRVNGEFSFEVSALLRRSIIFINDYDYLSINKRDTNVSSGFNFRYKEIFGTFTGIFSNFDEKDVTYYIGAARQLRDKFGSNMAQYVPNPGSINIFNGDFNISDTTLDGWEIVNTGGFTNSLISAGQILYSSLDDAGQAIWTSETPLVDGVKYEVIVDKDLITSTQVFIIAGTNEVELSQSTNKEKINITANGTELKIRFNSIVAGSTTQRQAYLNSIQVYLSEVVSPAKFLVDDFEPTYFKDYPFDLPFIHSDNLVDLNIQRNTQFLDQNGVEISTIGVPLNVETNDFAVNRMILGIPPANTKSINVWLDASAAVSTGYIEIGHIGDGGKDTHTSGTLEDNPTSSNPQEIEGRDTTVGP